MSSNSLDPARPFLISPPFGRYLSHARAYSVLGSYTVEPRPGRLGQVLRTVRPLGRTPDGEPNGWLNKVGLRNPGAFAAFPLPISFHGRPHRWTRPHQIVSLASLTPADWLRFERWVDERGIVQDDLIVELNVSCPNVDEHPELPPVETLRRIVAGHATFVVKLPPVGPLLDLVAHCCDAGVRYLHLSNTLPTPVGGLSGRALRETNLPRVEGAAVHVARSYPGVELIGGGGIYEPEHLTAYRSAGATRFSIATACVNPLRARRLLRHGTS